MKKCFFPIFAALLFASCSSSKYYISEWADIHKYKIATIQNIMAYSGSPYLMDMDVKLYDALAESGIRMIGENEIGNLSFSEKESLLYVKYSATQNDEETVVSITFVDYITLRPVANCNGSHGHGWSLKSDANNAISNALEQLKLMWK